MTKNQELDEKIAKLHVLYQGGELPANLTESYQVFQNQITCLRAQSLPPETIVKAVEQKKKQQIQKLTDAMLQEQSRGQDLQAVISRLKVLYEETQYQTIEYYQRWLMDACHPGILTLDPDFEKIATLFQLVIPGFTVNQRKELICMEEFLLQKVPYLTTVFEYLLKQKNREERDEAKMELDLYIKNHLEEIEQDYDILTNDLFKDQFGTMIQGRKKEILLAASVMEDYQTNQSWGQINLYQLQQDYCAQQQNVETYKCNIQKWDAVEVTPAGSSRFLFDLFQIEEREIQQRVNASPWVEDRLSHYFQNQFNQLIKETVHDQVVEDNETLQQIVCQKLNKLPNRLDLITKAQGGAYKQPSHVKVKKPIIYKPSQ